MRRKNDEGGVLIKNYHIINPVESLLSTAAHFYSYR
jgi:hypothetical protein